ncbi:MAG TPA: aminopeptidase P family protein [Candidatus Latescibacteria bacterium]|nr:aminopeptidase P family protein [Candidatus Latescibacterota bacterium]HRU23876.1 aminopeptidase P family protein [Candidatus Latescibacterota bacterium]
MVFFLTAIPVAVPVYSLPSAGRFRFPGACRNFPSGEVTLPQPRIVALRRAMRAERVDRFLVTCPEHVRWLSGFSGSSAWLVVGVREKVLLTDFRYRDQAAAQAPDWRAVITQNGLVACVRELAAGWGDSRVGFESAHLTVKDHRALTSPFKDGDTPLSVQWVATEQIIERELFVKDEAEIAAIARSAAIADAAFAEVLPLVKPGVTERDLATELEYRVRKLGADRMAFPPIVASGPNAALPHAQPSDRRIRNGDMVTFDIGAQRDGYASDMTRTVAVGKASKKLQKVYGIVLEAQMRAVAAVRPGLSCVELDSVARSYIQEQGFGEAFGHSLGHGVGLRVHDGPSISWRSQETLAEGMVITIEPGIYLTGWGGVRIEDLAVVTDKGCRVLCSTPKELRIV